MENKILEFIKENNLTLFENDFSKQISNQTFKTKEAKAIHSKVLSKISDYFVFNSTKNIFSLFNQDIQEKEIQKRQEFFKLNNKEFSKDFLRKIKKQKSSWQIKYDIVAITEDETTLLNLKKLNCPVLFVNSENDLQGLENYDLIQVIDCDNYQHFLERFPNTVFIDKIQNIYLERFLIQLSEWKSNLEILKNQNLGEEINQKINQLCSLFFLIEKENKIITREEIEFALTKINENVFSEIKKMTLQGDALISIISQGIPKEINFIIETEIKESLIKPELFDISIPVKLNEKELEKFLKKQQSDVFTDFAEEIKRNSEKIKSIPSDIKRIQEYLVYYDFISGISDFSKNFEFFPQISDEIKIEKSKNIFIEKAQEISFYLNQNEKCSILTGANSGGKTTLLEHIIQLISLSQIGLKCSGKIQLPVFSEIYYFAKTKGAMSKGAFENLLTQMSKISPGKKTLILADEIEAVTEPGVAGDIISATAEYFINKNCFLVIATHLGKEIKPKLPRFARIDGIEAKGLTENFDLIVDHNPVLGRLAHSTPELIIEKMAKSLKNEYFTYIYEKVKKE